MSFVFPLILAQAAEAADPASQKAALAGKAASEVTAGLANSIAHWFINTAGMSPSSLANVTTIVELLLKLIAVVLMLTITWWIASFARKASLRVFAKTDFDETLERFFANSIRWIVLLLGLIICLETFGVKATSLVALLGAAGVAVGLALQGSLSNFAAGIMLLVFRPFKVTDAVIVAGKEGTVDSIDLFTTAIDTADNRRIIIPNSQVFGSVIENHTHHTTRIITLKLNADPAADLETERKTLIDAANRVIARNLGTSENATPTVALVDLSANATWAVSLRTATNKIDVVREALLVECTQALAQAKLATPAPVQLVRTIA